MRSQFYHAIVLCALIAPACNRPGSDAPTPASSDRATSSGAAPTGATALPPSSTPTADNIRLGKDIIENIRVAAGGPALTAMRSFQAIGVSVMSVIAGERVLNVRAMYPSYYRQEEIPRARGGLGVAIGMDGGGLGWMLGAQLAGGVRSGNPQQIQDAYSRTASQAMAAFLAGVNAPWLVDSGKFTPVAAGHVESGDDRTLLIVNLEGPTGRAGRLLVDPGTNLPRRFIQPPQPGAGGEAGRNEATFTYSDFHAVGAVQLPHTIVRHAGTIQTTWTISTWSINLKIRPQEFTKHIAANVR